MRCLGSNSDPQFLSSGLDLISGNIERRCGDVTTGRRRDPFTFSQCNLLKEHPRL